MSLQILQCSNCCSAWVGEKLLAWIQVNLLDVWKRKLSIIPHTFVYLICPPLPVTKSAIKAGRKKNIKLYKGLKQALQASWTCLRHLWTLRHVLWLITTYLRAPKLRPSTTAPSKRDWITVRKTNFVQFSARIAPTNMFHTHGWQHMTVIVCVLCVEQQNLTFSNMG